MGSAGILISLAAGLRSVLLDAASPSSSSDIYHCRPSVLADVTEDLLCASHILRAFHTFGLFESFSSCVRSERLLFPLVDKEMAEREGGC